MGCIFPLAIVISGLRLRIPVWVVLVGAFVVFAVTFRVVWSKRHPGETMRLLDGPIAYILLFAAPLASVMAILAIQTAFDVKCPLWLVLILFFGAGIGVRLVMWRCYR